MSFTALKKLDRQARQFVDNTVFEKVDSDKTKKSARNSMKKIIVSLTSKVSELSSVLKVEKLIKSTIKEMNYLNDNYLNEKRIETLINRLEDHLYSFLDDYKSKMFDSDLDLSLSESSESDRSSSDSETNSESNSESDSNSESRSESDSDLSDERSESRRTSYSESSSESDELSSESDSDFDIKEDYNKIKDMDYFTCTESDCSCGNVFECDCSESDCSCDEDDNIISHKKLKQLKKYNRKYNKNLKDKEIDIEME
jgi:hypothetical protein